jgi:hypothetical protein
VRKVFYAFIMESSIVVFTRERLFILFMCVRLFMLFIRENLFVVFIVVLGGNFALDCGPGTDYP